MEANMKTMSQAEKTLLRYQYVMSNAQAAMGDYARTSDSWANRVRYLKQQFQALGTIIGEVFINAFKPALRAMNAFMTQVISFSRKIADALGAIFGWTIDIGSGGTTLSDELEDASESAGNLADGTGKAADNIKKMKAQLAGFDKLNNLTFGNDSDNGGGGSGGSGSVGTGGTSSGLNTGLKTTEGLVEKYKSSIKSLEELGNYIGDSLSRAMDSINWDSIYARARNFGQGLADFLNGLNYSNLFGSLGTTIAGALNTALHTLDSFGTTFSWSALGTSIATGINNFVTTIDWGTALSAAKNWGSGIATTLNDFAKTVKFDKVGSTISTALNTALEFLDSFGTTFDWAAFGNSISDGINAFFENFNFKKVWSVLNTFATGILDTLTTAINGIDWAGLGEGIIKFIFDPQTWISLLGTVVAGLNFVGSVAGAVLSIVYGLFDGLADIGGTIITTIFESIKNSFLGQQFAQMFETFKGNGGLKGLGEAIYEGTIKGFVDKIKDIGKSIKEFFDGFVNGVKDFFGIHSPARKVKYLGENILAGILEGFVGWIKNIPGKIGEFFSGFKKAWSTGKKKAGEFVVNLGMKAKETTAQVGNWAKERLKNWTGKVADLGHNTIQTAEKIGSWVSDRLKKWTGKTSDLNLKAKQTQQEITDTWGIKTKYWTGKTSNLGLYAFQKQSEITDAWGIKTKYWTGKTSNLGLYAFQKQSEITDAWEYRTRQWKDKTAYLKFGIKGDELKSNLSLSMNGLTNKTPLLVSYTAAFASGGFPEDGWFRANHGELMGKFDNGQTVVANNKQITDGIADAVYRGNQENNNLLRQQLQETKQQNEILWKILNKSGITDKQIFDSVRRSSKEYSNRTGNLAFT